MSFTVIQSTLFTKQQGKKTDTIVEGQLQYIIRTHPNDDSRQSKLKTIIGSEIPRGFTLIRMNSLI